MGLMVGCGLGPCNLGVVCWWCVVLTQDPFLNGSACWVWSWANAVLEPGLPMDFAYVLLSTFYSKRNGPATHKGSSMSTATVNVVPSVFGLCLL